jgi:2-phosphosulfolactate phosphatase
MTARIVVLETAERIDRVPLAGAAVAVVDVLRATTVLPLALAAGASRIVPAATLEEAERLHAAFPPGTALRCVEREGQRVPGFDLGNSPREYVPEVVAGKTLVHASTNGSRALVRAREARMCVAASLVNATAAAGILVAADTPEIVLVASGNAGAVSPEDVAGCGLLVERLLRLVPGAGRDATAGRALELWRTWAPDVLAHLAAVPHAVYLAGLGFEADFPICAGVDRCAVVPVMTRNGLVPG